jgi:GNAT superfamily N-acetyltransferase
MARSTDIGGVGDVGEAIRVVEVDRSTVGDFTHVMASGWDGDSVPLRELHLHMLAEGRQHMFIAYCDGVAAGAASYVPFARSAFLMSGVVLERFRGRGLYRALVHARLAHARARGLSLATTHAREDTSAPILEQLGFETVCTIPIYFG